MGTSRALPSNTILLRPVSLFMSTCQNTYSTIQSIFLAILHFIYSVLLIIKSTRLYFYQFIFLKVHPIDFLSANAIRLIN